ncbi:uncharacterized protein LOC108678185 [Hyalella azteca]|uniref:Uncharacterized protein LOC108678185 n=1 Tax=Hyalella azteca TaxID=294128 RepID=A0A8B7P793_HYAAZ|nr:uncharacterized protein LOC108678185 [Hyalella azteca]
MSSAINDFKSKLDGLLSSLHTLSSSEKQIAVSILSSTLSSTIFVSSKSNSSSVSNNKDSIPSSISDCYEKKFNSNSLRRTRSALCDSVKRRARCKKLPKKRVALGTGESSESVTSLELAHQNIDDDVQHNWSEHHKPGTILLPQSSEVFPRPQACPALTKAFVSFQEAKAQLQEKRPLWEEICNVPKARNVGERLKPAVLKPSEVPSESVRVFSRTNSETFSVGLEMGELQTVSLKPEGQASMEVSTSSGTRQQASSKDNNAERKAEATQSAAVSIKNEKDSKEKPIDNETYQQASVSLSQECSPRTETLHAHVQGSSIPQQAQRSFPKAVPLQQPSSISLQYHESLQSVVCQIPSSNDVNHPSCGHLQAQSCRVQQEASVSQIQSSLSQAQECAAPSASRIPQIENGGLMTVACATLEQAEGRGAISTSVASSLPSTTSCVLNIGVPNARTFPVDTNSKSQDEIDCSIHPSPLALDKFSMARDLREATETLEKSFSSLKEQQQWHLQQQALIFAENINDNFGLTDAEKMCRRTLLDSRENEGCEQAGGPSYTYRATQLLDHSLRVLGFNQNTRDCYLNDVLTTSHFDLPSDFSEVLDYSMQGRPDKLIEEDAPTDLSVEHDLDIKGDGSIIPEFSDVLHGVAEGRQSLDGSEPTDLSLSHTDKARCVVNDSADSIDMNHRKYVHTDPSHSCNLPSYQSLVNGTYEYILINDTCSCKTAAEDDIPDHHVSNCESMHRKCVKRKIPRLSRDDPENANESAEIVEFGSQDVVYDLSLPPVLNPPVKSLNCEACPLPEYSVTLEDSSAQTPQSNEAISFAEFSFESIVPESVKKFATSPTLTIPQSDFSSQLKLPSFSKAPLQSTDVVRCIPTTPTDPLSKEFANTNLPLLASSSPSEPPKDISNKSLKSHAISPFVEVQAGANSNGAATRVFTDEVRRSKGIRLNKINRIRLPDSIESRTRIVRERNIKSHHGLDKEIASALKSSISSTKSLKRTTRPTYICQICGSEFAQKVSYVRHTRGHDNNKCRLCSSSFSSWKALRAHSLVSHGAQLSAKTYDCQHCCRSFTKRVLLHAHTAKLHTRHGTHMCPKCGAELASAAALRQHLQDHCNKKLPCSLCNAFFSRRQPLLRHLKGHERNACPECGAACSSSKQLLAHCRVAHRAHDRDGSASADAASRSYVQRTNKTPVPEATRAQLQDDRYSSQENVQGDNERTRRAFKERIPKTVKSENDAAKISIDCTDTECGGVVAETDVLQGSDTDEVYILKDTQGILDGTDDNDTKCDSTSCMENTCSCVETFMKTKVSSSFHKSFIQSHAHLKHEETKANSSSPSSDADFCRTLIAAQECSVGCHTVNADVPSSDSATAAQNVILCLSQNDFPSLSVSPALQEGRCHSNDLVSRQHRPASSSCCKELRLARFTPITAAPSNDTTCNLTQGLDESLQISDLKPKEQLKSVKGSHIKVANLDRAAPAGRSKFRAPAHVYSRAHPCPSCPRVFGRPSLLREHLASHSVSGELAFRCEPCSKTFATRSGYRKHLLSTHHSLSRPSTQQLNEAKIPQRNKPALHDTCETQAVLDDGGIERECLQGDAETRPKTKSTAVGASSEENSTSCKTKHFESICAPPNLASSEGNDHLPNEVKSVNSKVCSYNANKNIENKNYPNVSAELDDGFNKEFPDRHVSLTLGSQKRKVDILHGSQQHPINDTSSTTLSAWNQTVSKRKSSEPESGNGLRRDDARSSINVNKNVNQTMKSMGEFRKFCKAQDNCRKPSYSCSLCDYSTKNKFSMKRHLDTHFNRRRFVCEACGKAFMSLLNLQDHHAFVHSTEKKFNCSHCCSAFKTRSTLVRHMQRHSDNKPYKCHCGNKYKRLSGLKKHKLMAHNEVSNVRKLLKVQVGTPLLCIDTLEQRMEPASGMNALCQHDHDESLGRECRRSNAKNKALKSFSLPSINPLDNLDQIKAKSLRQKNDHEPEVVAKSVGLIDGVLNLTVTESLPKISESFDSNIIILENLH